MYENFVNGLTMYIVKDNTVCTCIMQNFNKLSVPVKPFTGNLDNNSGNLRNFESHYNLGMILHVDMFLYFERSSNLAATGFLKMKYFYLSKVELSKNTI